MTEPAGKRDLAWLRQVSSFAVSKIILTTNNFRVFDYPEGKGKTAGDLAKAVFADGRVAELLLNSLVAAGLLSKKDIFYRNTPVASKYLVSGKPFYRVIQGAIFSINMLVNTARDRSYTSSEISSWMKNAGFTDIKEKILGKTVLISGTKKKS